MASATILALCLLTAASAEPGNRSAKKAAFIRGVNVKKLIRSVAGEEISVVQQGVGRRGVPHTLLRDGERIGGIEIGVFADPERAGELLQEHLIYTSAVPADSRESGNIGDKAFLWGTNKVLFVRDNALVAVGLPEQMCLKVAKAIDRALAEGSSGVQRAERMSMPRILGVQAAEEAAPGKRIDVKIRVGVPEHVLGDRLGFVDRMGVEISSNVPVVDTGQEVEIVRTLRYRLPPSIDEPEKISFSLCYATPGCVITRKTFTLAELINKSP